MPVATARDLIDIALAQLGTKESPAGSNNVRYNTAYYGREVYDGLWDTKFPWCVTLLWWCFREAGASALFYGGEKTASCRTLLGYYRARGQAVTDGDYQPGDLIFYNFQGGSDPEHVGLCESFGGATVVSIEGNTGIGNDANGGAVMRRSRTLGQIVGAARPRYEEGEDMDVDKLTDAQLLRLAERMQAALGQRAVGAVLGPELQEAVALGITDGTRPEAFCTRAQAAVMVKRAKER